MKDGAPDAVLIDGYNLLHAIPRFAPRGSEPAPARERFESWIATQAARRGVRDCVLVWDGRGGGRVDRRAGALTVLTTASGVTADDRILDLCRGRFAGRAAATWVVSSDRDIQVPARQLGFTVLGAMTFYRRWSAAQEARTEWDGPGMRHPAAEPADDRGTAPRPRPSRAEVDELLDAFLEAGEEEERR